MGSECSKLENSRGDNIFFPPEVIIGKILIHLSKRDKLIARQVCKDWNEIIVNSGDEVLKSKVQLVIQDSEYCDDPLRYLANVPMNIPWTRYLMLNLEINKNSYDFWSSGGGEKITHLDFYDCSFPVQNFNNERKFCPNLKYLSIRKSDKYLMMGGPFFKVPDLFHLDNLEVLDLSKNRYLNDYMLFSILLKTDQLKSINLSDTQLTFSSAVHNRFYPGITEPPTEVKSFSEYLLSFQMLYMAFLSLPRGQKMKELLLNETRINCENLLLISDIEKFNWESLGLKKCTEIKFSTLRDFLSIQKGVKKLQLKRSRIKTENLLEMNLSSLEYLKLKESTELIGTNFLKNCPKLKYLDLSFSPGIVPNGQDLSKLVDLEVLKMRSIISFYNLESGENSARAITSVLLESLPNLKNLTELDLGLCGSVVDNQVCQCILKHLKRLKILKLCKSKISDWGLTGGYAENDENSQRNELLGQDFHPNENACLLQLTDLRTLSVKLCLGLKDSWTFALKSNNLTSLDISGVVQLTIADIHTIIEYCPSLENFDISDTGIKITGNEQLISTIRDKLFRLRNLTMQSK